MTSKAAFEYKPLTGDEIRLLCIEKGGTDEAIKCTLCHVSLGSRPKFLALSYVWGDATQTVPITVDGTPFNATVNLHAGLRRIREIFAGSGDELGELDEQLFWIDALCINQDDVHEKSVQVPRMKDIYSSASKVLAWLGENEEKADDDIGIIFELSKILMKGFKQRGVPLASFVEDTEEEPISQRAIFKAIEEHSDTDASFHTIALWMLFQRPWFTRVWIIQEAILARDRMIFIAGAYWLPAEGLDFYCDAWTSSARLTAHRQGFEEMRRSYNLPSLRDEHTKRSIPKDIGEFASEFQELVAKTFSYKSTLPHDLVYGRLGLLGTDTLLPELLPDYSIPYAKVFQSYAALCFQHTRTLNLLMTSEHHLASVPSWVPDLRYLFGSANREVSRSTGLSISSDGNVLTVEALKLGYIEWVWRRQDCSFDNPATVQAAIKAFHAGIVAQMAEVAQISGLLIVKLCWVPLWCQVLTGSEKELRARLYQSYKYILEHEGVVDIDDPEIGIESFGFYYAVLCESLNHFECFVMNDGSPGEASRKDTDLRPGDCLCAVKGLTDVAIVRGDKDRGEFLGPCLLGGNFEDWGFGDGKFPEVMERWNLN